jgi:hypothetical protein
MGSRVSEAKRSEVQRPTSTFVRCSAENGGLDAFICGAVYDYGFAYDGNFAHQIRHRLFETNNEYGQTRRNDLVALNICRGREHGIPGYNTVRAYCGVATAKKFEDFGGTINYDGIQKLKSLYNHVDDVDLFVGLNLEDRVSGGLVGPTAACIIARQFITLRDGDRFFYTHKDVFPSSNVCLAMFESTRRIRRFRSGRNGRIYRRYLTQMLHLLDYTIEESST